MSEGKHAKPKKSRLDKEIEKEKIKKDRAEALSHTTEINVVTDDDIKPKKELSTKEKIFKALDEETRRIESDLNQDYSRASFNNATKKKYSSLEEKIDDLEDTDYDEVMTKEDDDIEYVRSSRELENIYTTEEEDKMPKRKTKKKSKKMNKGLKIFFIILLILLIIAAAIGIGVYSFIHGKLDKLNYAEIDTSNIGISQQADEKLKGYRTFAVFGVDSRGDNYDDDGNRSDSIILATLNQDTGEISMVSIYRDSYVDVDENGRTRLDKINHAFAYGGIENSLRSINKALDLNIREYIAVNFYALIDAVDALGGLDLNIENDERQVMNNVYIKELNEHLPTERPGYGRVENITHAGKQHVNGAQVLAYCRVRYTSGGDYKRTERMRTVINMLLDKVKGLSVGELNAFVDTMLPKVQTNVKSGDIIKLASGVFGYKMSDTSIGWPYMLTGWTSDAWYAVPCTLESNVVRLHQEVFGDSDYVASDEVKDMSSRIVSKTGKTEANGEESNNFNHVEQDLEQE